MRKTSRIYIIALLLIIMTFTISNVSYGISTEDYKPGTPVETREIVDKAVPLINILLTFGVIVGVVGISLLGLRYMLGSAQEKAEYKETMLPFIFAAVFIFSVCGILRVTESIFIEGETFTQSGAWMEDIYSGDLLISDLSDEQLLQLYSFNQISRDLGTLVNVEGMTLAQAYNELSPEKKKIFAECLARGLRTEEPSVLAVAIADGDILISDLNDEALLQLYSFNQISRDLGTLVDVEGMTLAQAYNELSPEKKKIYEECSARGLLSNDIDLKNAE